MAVTVIVDTTGCVFVPPPDFAVPPHPSSSVMLKTLNASSIICRLRRFFVLKKQSATASADPGNQRLDLCRSVATEVAAATVSVEVMVEFAVTVVGEKLQVTLPGRPVQPKVTDELTGKPFSGDTVMVSVPLEPAVIESEGAETTSAKSADVPFARVSALACAEAPDDPSASTASTT